MVDSSEPLNARVSTVQVLREARVLLDLVEQRSEQFLALAQQTPELLPDAIRFNACVQDTQSKLRQTTDRLGGEETGR